MHKSFDRYDYSQSRPILDREDKSYLYLDYNEYHGDIHPDTSLAFKNADKLLTSYFRPGDHSLEEELGETFGVRDQKLFLVSGADQALEEILGFCRHHLNLRTYFSYHQTTYDHFYTFAHKYAFENSSLELADIIYVCCPNNPDGIMVSPMTCAEMASTHLNKMFIFDLSYLEYSSENYSTYLTSLKHLPNVFILSSLAKVYPIAGLRSGWFYASFSHAQNFFEAYLNAKMINPVARHILASCLNQHQFYREQTRDIFSNRGMLAEILIKFFASKEIESELKHDLSLTGGNFFSLKFRTNEELKNSIDELEQVGIFIRHKSHWDFIRITSVNGRTLLDMRERLKC